MDLKYDIEMECKLETRATVAVVRGLLEASGLVPNFKRQLGDIYKEAYSNVDKLFLYKLLKTDIKALLRPVMAEMCDWYLNYKYDSAPVLTGYGTLDINKSFLALSHTVVAGNAFLSSRCRYLSDVWWKDCYDRCNDPVACKSVTEEDYKKSLINAVKSRDFATIQFFINKVPQEFIQIVSVNYLGLNRFHPVLGPMIVIHHPATYSIVFSGLSEAHQSLLHSRFYEGILNSLLRWPYQHLFLEAAKTMSSHLSYDACCRIATKILWKALIGYKDHDYIKLFFVFWPLRSPQCEELTILVKLMRNKRIATMVLGGSSEEFEPIDNLQFLDSYLSVALEDSKIFGRLQKQVDSLRKKIFSTNEEKIASFPNREYILLLLAEV